MITLVFVAICLFAFACTNDDDCLPDIIQTSILDNKSIIIDSDTTSQRATLSIENGTNLVFEYDFEAEQCVNIDDDEWGERLIFEIPTGTDDFEYIDSALISVNCYHLEYGAWVSSLPKAITEGSIKGTKLSNNKWKITATVKSIRELSQDDVTIDFTEKFEL